MHKYNYICDLHIGLTTDIVYPISPGRGKCIDCGKKKVAGYSNPDHISNPFGYLYLIPMICISCSENKQKCMWCK
jgi:hypothetical protein